VVVRSRDMHTLFADRGEKVGDRLVAVPMDFVFSGGGGDALVMFVDSAIKRVRCETEPANGGVSRLVAITRRRRRRLWLSSTGGTITLCGNTACLGREVGIECLWDQMNALQGCNLHTWCKRDAMLFWAEQEEKSLWDCRRLYRYFGSKSYILG
jgi:hypothetical protein